MKPFVIFLCAALCAIGGVTLMQGRELAALQTKLDEAHGQISRMREEHDLAIKAIDRANILRGEANEKARERERELEEALGADAGFSCGLLPDWLCRLLDGLPAESAGDAGDASSAGGAP